MELCSQMEQMEAFGENTQREPVDMDIDADDHPDTSANSTDVQPKCLSTMVPQTAPSATSTHNSVNNAEILLKLSMTPLLQKKAKPSTTKISAASSRSASLVVEMEKTVKPPLAANVIETKVARPLPAMPPLPTPPPKATPQHEFHQPLPRPPHPLNQPLKKLQPRQREGRCWVALSQPELTEGGYGKGRWGIGVGEVVFQPSTHSLSKLLLRERQGKGGYQKEGFPPCGSALKCVGEQDLGENSASL
ncbi:hypothetical protein SRHO_G00018590 [Serrasalmus rhombeus]